MDTAQNSPAATAASPPDALYPLSGGATGQSGTDAAGAAVGTGEPRVLSISSDFARVALDGADWMLPVDFDSDGTVRVAWWLLPNADVDALYEAEDALIEVLTDARTDAMREAA